MGLDIYLKTRHQHEQNEAHEVAWNELHDCGAADRLTEDEWRQWRSDHPLGGFEDVPSRKHPKHLFTRRYLRSSYNDAGFDHAVPEMTGTTHNLAWIFEPVRSDDEYTVELTEQTQDAMTRVHQRCEQVIGELRGCDRLRVMTSMVILPAPRTHLDALAWYREHKPAERDEPGWCMSRDGETYAPALPVLGLVHGESGIGIPAAHLIYRASDEAFDSYVASAEIIDEFCDEAAELVERDGAAYVSWSG